LWLVAVVVEIKLAELAELAALEQVLLQI